MNPGTLFSVVNLVAFISWLALLLRPRHPFVLRWAGLIVPLLFAVLYAIIIAMRIGHAGGDFRSLSGVAALFQDPWFLLAGWVHYLAFDLLTGVWEVRDAAARNLPPRLVVHCLFRTFLFGLAGWWLYMACGQDAACVAESAVGTTRFEARGADLYAIVTLPNVIVGTVGGGTALPSQRACLDWLGLAGPGHANALAEVADDVIEQAGVVRVVLGVLVARGRVALFRCIAVGEDRDDALEGFGCCCVDRGDAPMSETETHMSAANALMSAREGASSIR